MRQDLARRLETDAYIAREQRECDRRSAFIGHVPYIEACVELKELGKNMRRRAIAGGAVKQDAGSRLGQPNEI